MGRFCLLFCLLGLIGHAAPHGDVQTTTGEQRQARFNAHRGDFDYLLGDWQFTAQSKEYGAFSGVWSAVRLPQGQILDEYRVLGDDGQTVYVTTTVRAYNAAADRWELVGMDEGNGLQPLTIGAAQPPSMSLSPRRMLDGKLWTTENVNTNVEPSYCYDNSAQNCARYGRLYTWESAHRACQALGGGWRLPTSEEWRRLGAHYGGIRQESADLGKAAHAALIVGGGSGFNAVYGGGRTDKRGEYQRLEAHGFYWSATESSPDRAWFYNFGRGGQSFGVHENGEKLRAFSVRCVKD